MNDPNSVAEQARRRPDAARKRGGMMTTARRCAYVTALILVFLVMGVGGEARAQELPTVERATSADTLARADQELVDECGCYEGKFSTSLIRHKTH
jgi:hypothetical protein